MAYEKIVNEAKALMKQKCEEKRKAGTLSKVHDESHMVAVATFGAVTARALLKGEKTSNDADSAIDTISDITKIAGYLHDCEREATEKVPHGIASAKLFATECWSNNWINEMSIDALFVIYNSILCHEGSFKIIHALFGSPIKGDINSKVAHSIVVGDKAFEASGYRVLERRAFFVGRERTERGDLKSIFSYPNESHLSVLGETIIRLYARNPIDEYPDWIKPFAQEWHAIQYQFYKGLLTYTELDEVRAAEFFLSKKFPKFDQTLVDQIKTQQHLNGKYFDKTKYPMLANEIDKLNEMSKADAEDLAVSSFNLVKDIATEESPELAIKKYNTTLTVKTLTLKNYRRFFDGIVAYREGTDEFVKEIEDKIRVEVEKIAIRG